MRHTPVELDALDRSILNELQDGLPLPPELFGAITRFGPCFDAEAMGGAFCLCAMAVPDARFDEVIALVNAHPEVAHKYARDHRRNMWFVLATETPEGIGRVADAIEADTGLAVLRLPKQKEFFIGFRMAA